MKTKKMDLRKNRKMLRGSFKKNGFVRWRHIFTGFNIQTGSPKIFFIEIFIINPARSPTEPVFGQLYEQKTKKHLPSYAMLKAGAWGEGSKQIHEFFSIADLRFDRKIFNLRTTSLTFSETSLTGSVFMSENDVVLHPEYMSDAGSMSWDLTMEKIISYNPGFGINWHAQGTYTRYAGRLVLDDQTYIVTPEKSFGYADKHWGREFISPLLHLSSSHLISDITGRPLINSCFNIGAGFASSSKKMEPKFLAVFYYEGIKYEFPLSFFRKKSRVRFDFKEGDDSLHWLVSAETKQHLLDIDIYCKKNETLFMNYEAPSGSLSHKGLWSGGTGIGELKFFQKGGKKLELIESAQIKNTACEFGEFNMLDFI